MIDKKEVQRIGKLARIELAEEEQSKLQKDLSSILDNFSSLKTVNVSKINPMFHANEHFLRNEDFMREDREEQSSPELQETLISMAPGRSSRHVKVKPVF